MADKSFEQQVKNELSELRMKPGTSVWPVVEAALQKERKRRWLVWLFLLAGCAGASFWGYYYFNQDKEVIAKIPAQIQSLPKEEVKEIAREKDAPPVATQTPVQQKTEPAVTVLTPSTEPGKKNLKLSDVSPGKNVPVKTETNRDASVDQKMQNRVVTNAQNNSQASDIPKPQAGTLTGKTTDNSSAKDTKKDIDNPTAIPQQAAVTKDPVAVSSVNDEKVTETSIPVIPPASNEAPPATSTVVKNKKGKWQWNIGVDAGSSGLREAIRLPGFATEPLSYANAPGAINGTPAPLLTVEPPVKDAFSFGMQLQATKQLGKKHRFGLSAGYSLFQTSMNVGRRVDSSSLFNNYAGANYSSFYYINTDSTAYTNKYHFLRLGADLYTPFRLFKKVSFQWQLGAGINVLAATNGLHYDAVTKKLFINNALYAKTQSYISTGIDLSIGKTPFLYIGPHWQYSFTNLTSRPGGDQHLFLSSVKVSFVLPKKKK